MKLKIATFAVLILVNIVALGLTVWVSWEGEDFFKEVASEFELETGVKVDLLYIPKMADKLQLSLRTGNLPDLCLIKDTHTGNVAASGRAIPLGREFFEKLGQFSDDSLEAFALNEKFYAVPYYADLQVAFLNRSLVSNDLLKNLEEGHGISELSFLFSVHSSNEVIPAAWDFMSPYIFFSFLSGYGDVSDSRGMPAFSSETYRNAVEDIHDLFISEQVARLERQAMISYFMDNKLAYMIQGTYLAPQFRDTGIDFQILPLPRVGDKNIPAVMDSKGFALFNEDSLEEASAFLSLLYESSMEFAVTDYKVPLWTKSLPEELHDFEVIMKNTVRMPNDMRFQQIYSEAMRTVLQVVFAGSMSIEDALHSAQAYAEYNW